MAMTRRSARAGTAAQIRSAGDSSHHSASTPTRSSRTPEADLRRLEKVEEREAQRVRPATVEDEPVVADLAFEYLTWAARQLHERYGIDWPPIVLDEVQASVADYRSEGVMLIAELDGRAVGIGAVHRLADGSAEIKRMFVRGPTRGRGVGSAILDALLAEAKAMGAARAKLDSARFMTDAHGLYRSRGFVECKPYAESEIPRELQQHWVFMVADIR